MGAETKGEASMTLEEFKKWKKAVQRLRTEYDQAKGELKSLSDSLKEMGIGSLKEAQERLDILIEQRAEQESQIQKLEARLEEAIAELQQE